MEDAIKSLVELFVKEYEGIKKDVAYYHNMADHLANQNEVLRSTEQKNADNFARLKKLLAPNISWFDGKPLYISGINAEMLCEICEILKIENYAKYARHFENQEK